MNIFKSVFREPLRSAGFSLAQLGQLLQRVSELDQELPDITLTSAESDMLKGYLFHEGPLLVWTLGRLLRDEALFPEFPGQGEWLLEQYQQMAFWCQLSGMLQELSQRCATQHRLCRGLAVQRALKILAALRAEQQAYRLTPRPRALRDVLLGGPQRVVDAWQRRIKSKRR